jgi:hypothetical protein
LRQFDGRFAKACSAIGVGEQDDLIEAGHVVEPPCTV